MPIIFSKKVDPYTSLSVWHINETEEELLKDLQLSKKDLNSILSLRLAKRRKERIACRKALAFLMQTSDIDISYGKSGEPLMEGYHISFSHSGEYAAAIVSKTKKVGIDIERISEKILNLYPKFVNEEELKFLDFKNPKEITQIWSAKEAIYKLSSGKSPDFLHNIFIDKSLHSASLIFSEEKVNIDLVHWAWEGLIIVAASV